MGPDADRRDVPLHSVGSDTRVVRARPVVSLRTQLGWRRQSYHHGRARRDRQRAGGSHLWCHRIVCVVDPHAGPRGQRDERLRDDQQSMERAAVVVVPCVSLGAFGLLVHELAAAALNVVINTATAVWCRLLKLPIILPRMRCVCILRLLLQPISVVLRRELR